MLTVPARRVVAVGLISPFHLPSSSGLFCTRLVMSHVGSRRLCTGRKRRLFYAAVDGFTEVPEWQRLLEPNDLALVVLVLQVSFSSSNHPARSLIASYCH